MASRGMHRIRDDDDDAPRKHNIDSHVNICNTFWRPSLTFHPHNYGGTLVAFESLWPVGEDLRMLVRDVFAQSALREAVIECAKLVLRCGPVRVLKELLRCRIIGLSQRFEPFGNTMLHLACIARNQEAVTFLLSSGISTKNTDKFGRTAEQVCYCSKTKRLLTLRSSTPMKRPNTPASLQDKDTLFNLVRHSKSFDEIQIKLQSLDFDINKERNAEGDTLIHSAVRVGLSQLALILNLVYIQCADIEEYTRYGMTPLCIAAENGHAVIAEVLISCLGADPNNANPRNRWTPLHYAAKENKLDVVNVLIKRGADVNLESMDYLRADDLAKRHGNEDCEEAIVTKRTQRCELLSNRAENARLKETDLRETDQFMIDGQDRTLLMVAAEYNRIENLRILLSLPKCPVNAQHPKTLRTALSLAAFNGHARAVQVLIQNNADASIKDIYGYLPLHYACEEQHKKVVETIIFYDHCLVGLEKALHLSTESEIRDVIELAMERRQKQVVTPALFECAANGNANRLFCVLEDGDNVNPLTGAGDWPLMVAVENGHLDLIQLLYERGGDVSRRHPSTNATVLHVASARGHVQVVKFLLHICKRDGLFGPGKAETISCYLELDINAMNNSGQTALQMAANKGFSKVLRALLMRGASSAILDADGNLYKCQDYEGVQCLLETHRKDRAMRIMALIRDRKGLSKLKKIWQPIFDHNLRNFKGDSPLMVACYHGRVEVVRFLLQSAIHRQVIDSNTDSYWNHDQSDTDSGSFMDHTTSAMMNSRFLGTRTDPSSASELSDTESNYMYTKPRRCRTPSGYLQQSAEFTSSGRFNRYATYPVSSLKRISPVSSDDDLAVAAAVARQQKAQDLNRSFNLREQAFRDVVGPHTGLSKGDIYLISFSEHNNPPYFNMSAALKRVINHLCDYNARDGSTCLHRVVECASENHAVEIIQMLLEKDKSCVNMQDYSGLTPLHLACSQAKKHVVKMLTDLDFIDLNVRTLDGKLPEELTLNKTIQKMVYNARELHPYEPLPGLPTPPASSVGDGSIDLDKLNDRFQQLLRSQDS